MKYRKLRLAEDTGLRYGACMCKKPVIYQRPLTLTTLLVFFLSVFTIGSPCYKQPHVTPTQFEDLQANADLDAPFPIQIGGNTLESGEKCLTCLTLRRLASDPVALATGNSMTLLEKLASLSAFPILYPFTMPPIDHGLNVPKEQFTSEHQYSLVLSCIKSFIIQV